MSVGIRRFFLDAVIEEEEAGGSAPTAPTSVTFSSNAATSFTVNWVAGTGQDSYEIQIATDAGFTTVVQDLTATSGATSKAVSSLTTYVQYWARVRGVNGFGNSAYATSAAQFTLFDGTLLTGALVIQDPASGVTLNTTTVSDWNNQVASKPELTQATAANQPLFVSSQAEFNSLPSIRLVDSTDFMQNSATWSPALPASVRIFMVFRKNSTTTSIRNILGVATGSWNLSLSRTASGSGTPTASATTISIRVGGDQAVSNNIPIICNHTKCQLIDVDVNGTSSAIKVDNVAITLVNTTALSGVTTTTVLNFPQNAAGSSALGEYGDLYIFDRSTFTDSAKVISYLMTKYNL